MDAYFAEGEAKSRAVDKTPGPKKDSSSGIAPPPKAGGPPRSGGSASKEAPFESEEPREEAKEDGKKQD